MRRVGVAATLVVAGLSEWCLSQPKEQPLTPPSLSAEEAVPPNPLIAESSRAFTAGERMGKDILVYFNTSGHESYFRHARELSANETGAEGQGGNAGCDVSVLDKGPTAHFEMGDFEAWREAQMAELNGRPEIKDRLQDPGTGVLFSGDGAAFLSRLLGDRIQLQQVAAVEPFIAAEEER